MMRLANLCLGVLLIWLTLGQGPTGLAAVAAWRLVWLFYSGLFYIPSLSPSLLEKP